MGTLAIGLWPPPGSHLNPEKAFAFLIALAVWLFVELFPDQTGQEQHDPQKAGQLTTHDIDLARSITQTANGDFVRFLKGHDFGASWHKQSLDPAYNLGYLLEDANSIFNDGDLNAALDEIKQSNAALTEKTAHYGGPIAKDLFDMIPTMEKGGILSKRTEERIEETNKAADQLAEDLESLFAALRRRGLSLAKRV